MDEEGKRSQGAQGEPLRLSKCRDLPILIQNPSFEVLGSFLSLSSSVLGCAEHPHGWSLLTSPGREKNPPTLAAPQPSAAQFMSNLQTFNIAASQFIKSNSARAKSLGNGFRITRGVTGSS